MGTAEGRGSTSDSIDFDSRSAGFSVIAEAGAVARLWRFCPKLPLHRLAPRSRAARLVRAATATMLAARLAPSVARAARPSLKQHARCLTTKDHQPYLYELYTIPNALSALRIAAAPGVGWLVWEGHHDWAVAMRGRLVAHRRRMCARRCSCR